MSNYVSDHIILAEYDEDPKLVFLLMIGPYQISIGPVNYILHNPLQINGRVFFIEMEENR